MCSSLLPDSFLNNRDSRFANGNSSAVLPDQGGNTVEPRYFGATPKKEDLLSPEESIRWNSLRELMSNQIPPINTQNGIEYRQLRYKALMQEDEDLSALSEGEIKEWKNFFGMLLPGDRKFLEVDKQARYDLLSRKLVESATPK